MLWWILLGHVLCFLELLALGRLVRWLRKPGAAAGGENSRTRTRETVGVVRNGQAIQSPARGRARRGR